MAIGEFTGYLRCTCCDQKGFTGRDSIETVPPCQKRQRTFRDHHMALDMLKMRSQESILSFSTMTIPAF
jgi:hypothetical protein